MFLCFVIAFAPHEVGSTTCTSTSKPTTTTEKGILSLLCGAMFQNGGGPSGLAWGTWESLTSPLKYDETITHSVITSYKIFSSFQDIFVMLFLVQL